MRLRKRSNEPGLGISPGQGGPYFSAKQVAPGEYQEHMIFTRDQLDAWLRVQEKQRRGQELTQQELEAIEPVARLILRIQEHEFEALLLVNTDLLPREEADPLLEQIGEAFYAPLNRDGTTLLYYTETPYRYEWS